MTRYSIEHRPEEQRFVVMSDDSIVGYAQYQLAGDDEIDFNGTVVDPTYRGSGLAALLVETALGDDLVANRRVHASCWYVAQHIDRHPEHLATGAVYAN